MLNGDYLYIQIYKKLLEEIQQQNYKPGDRLPTEKELSDKYKVSRITSQKAMNMLVEEGVVVRYPGLGSFVAGGAIEETLPNELLPNGGKRKIIGLVLEALWYSFGIGLFDGAYEKAKELGCDLVIKKSYGNQHLEMEAINELIDMGAEGIIVMPVHGDYYSQQILKLIVEKFPIVFVDRYLKGINVPFIGSDNINGIYQAVQYLVEKGHENIALVTAKDQEATTLDERKQGFIEASLKHNLKFSIYDKAKCLIPFSYHCSDIDETYEGIRDFLVQSKGVSAVVATEYYWGTLVKKAAKSIGKRIPEDLNVICFDAPHEHIGEYEFTHIRQDEEEMGRQAVVLLDQIIDNEEITEKTLIETSLVKGNSTK